MRSGPAQVIDKPGAIELEDTGSGYDIDLQNVTFGYRPDQPILQVPILTLYCLCS